ncbi:helix-turn-helix domain-containing protein [Paenibacillus glycanilyticus]|uniref:HTH-type transcriptional regulator YbfI n=1 Tax=Paenibacillus glycanilyticus TaxID=126569 RepID=A0ABQ6GCJ1_9BACL|nr:AraC family transcriptional regulator [Paenibacillus glycanilyticus]GLX68593.1 putative HTH-type transcriptional regulator YbfI [Paenibacillus glycanilyticus]
MDHYTLSGLGPTETIGILPDYYLPPYITLAHMFSAPDHWAVHNRVMKQYVLQYVVNGVADYPIEGNSYTTRRGDLIFHRPNELHSILPHPSEPYVCISIVFHFGHSSFPIHELCEEGEHYLGNFADHPIDRWLSELVAHYRQPGLTHQMRCQSLLIRILSEAAHTGRAGDSTTNASKMPPLMLLTQHLQTNYHREVQLGELAELSGWSKNHLLFLFRQYVGMSPIQYLTWVRINKAKELAIQTNLTVSEIAERVGYSDVHTFGRMFKKKTGLSLSQFCANLIRS